jgi:formyltetrahydrofolate deformylase
MDFRLAETATRNGSPSRRRRRTTACSILLWRNRRGELGISVVMVITNHPRLADQLCPFRVSFIFVV